MPYRYRCRQCRAESPDEHPLRAGAEADQAEHRDQAHAGLAPLTGDCIDHVHSHARGDGLLPRHTLAACLFVLALVLANCWGR